MAERIICGLMLVVALTQFLPVLGVMGVDRLNMAYGISISDPNLEILMRHRAVLFGLLGLFIGYAAFTPALQPMAFIAAALSIFSFFWLAWSVGDFNLAIRKIVIGDVIATVALMTALALYLTRK